MILSIHQPEHAVYGGYLDKMRKSDLFVILDTVQFSKNYFHNRNRVGTETQARWITVPVRRHPLQTRIMDIQIADVRWKRRYLNILEHLYRHTPRFDPTHRELSEIIEHPFEKLSELNVAILQWLRAKLGIATPMTLASELATTEGAKGSALVLDICRRLGASTYIAGVGGRNYLDDEAFADAGIELHFNEWHGSMLSTYDTIFRSA